MQGFIKDQKGVVVVVALMLSLAVLVVSLTSQSRMPAQAHDDGTLHIHPTPTPTPLPPLGLNGPLSLDTGIVYQKSQHRLVLTTVVNNPPPEGWYFNWASSSVYVNYKGWNFETEANNHDNSGRVSFQDGVITANLPLPEYVDFNQLTEPMIARVNVSMEYGSDRGQRGLNPRERMYVDLHDRRNWRE